VSGRWGLLGGTCSAVPTFKRPFVQGRRKSDQESQARSGADMRAVRCSDSSN
jgi:hypothetical protein